MKKPTVSKLMDQYLDYCRYTKQLRPSTMANYEAQLGLFLRLNPVLEDVNELTPKRIMAFFKTLETRKRMVGRQEKVSGVKKSTIEAYWNKLNAFFNWIVIQGHLDQNPLNGFSKPRPTYVDKRSLEKQEIEKILTAICVHAKSSLVLKRDLAIFYLLLMCGIRKGELLGLLVRDIRLDKGLLTVRGEVSKSKRTRTIPLNSTASLHLQEYLKARTEEGYTTPVLITSTTRDQGLSTHGLKHWVDKLREKSGVKFHIHQFRHTFACGLGLQNTSVIKIQKLLGHMDLRMTQRYLRSMGVEELRDAVDSLSIDKLS